MKSWIAFVSGLVLSLSVTNGAASDEGGFHALANLSHLQQKGPLPSMTDDRLANVEGGALWSDGLFKRKSKDVTINFSQNIAVVVQIGIAGGDLAQLSNVIQQIGRNNSGLSSNSSWF